MTLARNGKRWRFLASIAAVLIFAEVLAYPLGSDVSVFQWITLRLVRDGALPYVGSWDHNFPGVVVFHAIAIVLFGNSELGFRIMECAVQLATSALIYVYIARRASDRAAFFSVLFYAVGSTHMGVQYLGQRDVFAGALMLWAIAPWFTSQSPKARGAVFSGVLLALVVLIRPLFGLLPLAILAIEFRQARRSVLLAYVSAFSLTLVLSVVPYVITGGLYDYYESTILFNLALYGAQKVPIHYLITHALQFFPLILSAVLLLLFPSEGIWTRRERWIVIAFIATATFSLLIQAKYLVYHYAALVAILSPMGGIGIDNVLKRISHRVRAIVGILVAALLLLLYAPTLEVGDYVSSSISHRGIDPNAFDRLLLIGPATGKSAEDSVIHFVTANDSLDTPIEVASYDGRLRMRFELPMASRFTMMHGLNAKDKNGGHPAFQERWRKEYIEAIDSARCPFVVLSSGVGYWELGEPRYTLSQDYPQLFTLLHTKYQLVRTYGTFEIYARRS